MTEPRSAPQSASHTAPNAVDRVLWVLAVVAVAGTLWLSLRARGDVAELLWSDKLGHAMAYAADTFLLLLAVVWRPGRAQALVAWVVPIALGLLALGGVVEVIQGLTGRDAEILDWLANATGVGVALVAFSFLRRRFGARPGALRRGRH